MVLLHVVVQLYMYTMGTAVVAQKLHHGSSRRSQPSVAATTTPLAKQEIPVRGVVGRI